MYKALSEEILDEVSPLLKMLSNPLRLKILDFLKEGEKAVFEIVENTGVSQALVSHQLTMMKNNRLIKSRKEKNFVYYSISNESILHLLEAIYNLKK